MRALPMRTTIGAKSQLIMMDFLIGLGGGLANKKARQDLRLQAEAWRG